MHNGVRTIRVEGVKYFIAVIKSGLFNPKTYDKPEHAHIPRNEVENTIKLRRDIAAAAFERALARKNASSRVEVLSARPGDAPEGIRGVAQAADAGPMLTDEAETTQALIQIRRQEFALNTTRVHAEIAERNTSRELAQFRLDQERKQAAQVDAKIAAEAAAAATAAEAAELLKEKAALEKRAAEERVALEKSEVEARVANAAAKARHEQLEAEAKAAEAEARAANATAKARHEQLEAEAKAAEAEANAKAARARAEKDEYELLLLKEKADEHKRKRSEEAAREHEQAAAVMEREARIVALEAQLADIRAQAEWTAARDELARLYVERGDVRTVRAARARVDKKKPAALQPQPTPAPAPAPVVAPPPDDAPAPVDAPPPVAAPAPAPERLVPPELGVRILDEEYARYTSWGSDPSILIVANRCSATAGVIVIKYARDYNSPEILARKIATGTSFVAACEGFQYRRPMIEMLPPGPQPNEVKQWAAQMFKYGIDYVQLLICTDRLMPRPLTLRQLENRCNGLKIISEIYGRCERCGAAGHRMYDPTTKAPLCKLPKFTGYTKPFAP